MNEPLKQLSDDVAKKLKAKIESSEFASFIAQTKTAGDDRTFEVVMSTSDEDRQGDALDQSGWDLKYFNLNPVVLWAHNYSGFPIGIVTDIQIEDDKAIATGKFAPEGINPEADLACKLYQQKILRTVSPGYIQNDDGTRELLEMSFCSVPAGRYALSMRQVAAIGYSTPELIAKGFFYKNQPEQKAEGDPKAGDPCELDDGTPGVLAKDPKNPDRLVCVPTEDKSAKKETEENMKNELEKNLKAEHKRYGEAVGKAIDEFTEKCMKSEKSEGVLDKAIEEYTKTMDGEQSDHHEKCMKAIDDNYELQDQTPKKAIDEFKAEMKAEHLAHVQKCDKAIDEFKAEPGYSEDEKKEAIDEFAKAMGSELDRHEKCHMDMVKAEAENMGEGEDDGKDEDGEKFIEAAVIIGIAEGQAKQLFDALTKAGRAISAKNKEKLNSIIKMIEDGAEEHQKSHAAGVKHVIEAIKELTGSEEGDDGEEHKPEEKGGAPKPRSSTSGAKSELESYLFIQKFARQVKTTAEDVLRQVKPKIGQLSDRRR